MRNKIKEAQEALKLRYFLKKNYKDALAKAKEEDIHTKEIEILRENVIKELEVREIRWDCGWNNKHFRGCLLSFKSLIEHHPEIKHSLKNRVLVFSNFTGVSLDGHVTLYSGEVRHNWLDFIKNIKTYDAALTRLPAFEKTLSLVLRNIKIGRRKFMPKIIAGNYEEHLRQMTTSISDYLVKNRFPKEWPKSLQEYEIVVETEAGPLMVSPTGQFIVPSTLPGVLLVSFITDHMSEAQQKIKNYQRNKYLERSLIKKCIDEFKLGALLKDDNITPDLMINCCEKLLRNKFELQEFLCGLRLNISTYYSVLTDGVVCIHWNFEV